MDHSICCIKECEKEVLALGLCSKHWRRNRLYGSPVALQKHSGSFFGLTPEQRFKMQYKVAGNGCWEWTGGKDRDGYGLFRGETSGQMFKRAHRWSWAYHNNSEIKPGQMVCHSCDSPKCVNPEHLFIGDALINMQDKAAKGRSRVPFGENCAASKITEQQAREILADPRPYAAIAADYGLNQSSVGSIKQRLSWGHLDVEHIGRAKRVSPKKGKSEKVTPEIVKEIRDSLLSGKSLAEKFGISPQLVCDIKKRRSWAHVE